MKNNSIMDMYVIKRNGNKENVDFNKITKRISNLINDDEKKNLNPVLVSQKTIASIYPGVTTELLDIESAKICANMATIDPLYNNLAGRILVSNLQKKTNKSFSEKMKSIQQMSKDNGKSLLDKDYYNFVINNSNKLDTIIDYKRDFRFDYFGFKTIERYLIKNIKTKEIYETPQDLFLRVAVFLNRDNMDNIVSTYNMMSSGYYTHASPTLFNAGLARSQLASCFLVGTEDSMNGITKTWSNVSQISKWGGGIGVHISNIRGKGSIIRGTNGPSSGIVPMLKVYNEIARYVNQGGKRKGSFAIYLEPHHPDLMDFLELRKNTGVETERTRDLFLALWISDLFMKQVKKGDNWYFLCPDECPGLTENYGEKYEELYWNYVRAGKYKSVKPAQEVMRAILESQIETGMPYMGYKDNVNKKSNQKNLGTIKSSNLCIEIMEYSDDKEYATCNLASIALNHALVPFKQEKDFTIYSIPNCKFCKYAKTYMTSHNYNYNGINYKDKDFRKFKTYPQIFYGDKHIGGFDDLLKFTANSYDYKKLYNTAYIATVNLNKVIDLNYYPCIETKRSNMKHRPIGLGIQGLADCLVNMKIPFESKEACEFNNMFMETIYMASVNASIDLAKERYDDMKLLVESKANVPELYDSKFVIYNKDMNKLYHKLKPCKKEMELKYAYGAYGSFDGSPASKGILQFDMWNHKPSKDWSKIKERLVKYGMRNSLLTALMPTASTSQILGNTECFEFFTSNIYSRRTLSGDFVMVNKHLVKDLQKIGLWNSNIKDVIIAMNGSVEKLDIPKSIKNLYKTIWEIKQVWVLKNSLARSPFVDQSQSMNIYMAKPNFKKLFNCHLWAWENGLKTGMYYLRSKPSVNASKFTIDPRLEKLLQQQDNYEVCESCSG